METEQYTNDINEMQEMVKELNYLHLVSQRISEKKDHDELLCEIMESCKEVMNAEASSLLIYNEAENNLSFQIATGAKGEAIKNIVTKMGEGIAGWVAENRTPLLIEDCYLDPRFNKQADIQSNFRTKSMICVPMIRKDKLIGVIQVINKKGNQNIFTQRDLNIFNILASQCAISIENERLIEIQIQQRALERELKTAREIQLNLLPAEIPHFNDLDVSFQLCSAKQVGGDYFNVYKVNDHQTLFFICDVSGKSISAALVVSTICSCILTYFKMIRDDCNEFDLIELVKSLNKVLIESTTDEKFATAWFGLYDHNLRKITSVNAGHTMTYVFNENGEMVNLEKGGLMLGSIDMNYECEIIDLKKGDVVLCYTDGIPEAMDENKNFYTDERLVEFMKKNVNVKSNEILQGIFADVKDFVKGYEQSDDITCGVIKVSC